MRKTMNVWVLVVMCATVLAGFFWFDGSLSASLSDLQGMRGDCKVRQTQLQNEQADLKAMLETVGTDAFVEHQARTLYDYMMPDETRFVISNPEALYGEQGMPSR